MKTNQYKCLDTNEWTTPTKEELEKYLDETRAPLSDDEMVAMSAYFDSENFQHEDYLIIKA